MATQTEKVYRIQIQTDAAQQAVEAARKKLAELDAQLEGIDKNSDAGRAIVAAMDKLVGEVEAAEGRVEGLNDALDNLKPGTLPALRAEIEELEKELDQTTRGTAEFNTALLKLGNAKGELKKVEDAIDALDPKMKAAAFVDFANGVVGAFTIATTAAQQFGLSKETAEAYQQKLLSLIAVMDGVEQVSRALSSETQSVIKGAIASGKAFFGMGEAAATGSRTARVALASTGIGLLIVALGALYALWQDFGSTVKGSESNFTKFKATAVGAFDAVLAGGKNVLLMLKDIITFDPGDFAQRWASFGKESATAYTAGRAGVIDEARRAELAHEVEKNKQYVEVLKAKGRDTLALEVAIAKQNLEAQKAGSKEQIEALVAYTALRAQLTKRGLDDERAARLAVLNGLIAAEQARGADSFKQQLAAKKEQIAQLNQLEDEGAHISAAQRIQLDSELAVLQLARDKELADKRAALQGATLAAQLVRLQASTTEQSLIEVEANSKQIEIVKQHRATLLAQAQVDKAAVVAADADLYKLRLDRSRIFYRQEAEQAQAVREEYTRAIDALRAKDAASEAQYQANLNRAQQAGARVTKQIADELAAELQLKAMKAAADADIGGNLLIRLFGLTDAQAQSLKGRLAEVATNVGGLVAAMMAGATADADAALTDAQARLSQLSEQLSAASAQRQSDEAALQSATGARREYLLGKIQKEQAAESKLAAEKQKAAREEQAAQKEKAKLDKIQQEITAASSLVEATLLGIKAAKAVVDAADKGKIGYDNIALAIAAAAAIGISIVSMKNIAKSMGDGGIIEGGSHASGNDVPIFGGRVRVEGGEGILPVDATANNMEAFDILRTKGRKRKLTVADFAEIGTTQVRPAPAGGSYGAGGIIGKPAAAASALAQGQIVINEADLSELVAANRQMLGHMQALAASNQQIASYGPAQFNIGPYEATKIAEQKQYAEQAQGHATL